MPRELVAVDVRKPVIREYTDSPLQRDQIRVRTLFGAPKHGTEMHMYRGDNPFADSYFDYEQRIFRSRTENVENFPMPLGNMAVGEVVQMGAVVEGVTIGDTVVGYGPLRETQTWTWNRSVYPGVRKLPDGMNWRNAVCLDPVTVALGGIRDGGVRVGDRVSIFGLGAIGLAALQVAMAAGASFITVADPIASRRDVAKAMGADLVLDPASVDAGLEIRNATGGQGVDVSLETSGNPRALHHAIRGLAFGGTVAVCAWYTEMRGGLDLGREAHFNRVRLVFPRAESEPHYDYPRWDNLRQADAAWELLVQGQVNCEQIVTPVVSFEDTVAAYRDIDEHPEHSIKLGVRFE